MPGRDKPDCGPSCTDVLLDLRNILCRPLHFLQPKYPWATRVLGVLYVAIDKVAHSCYNSFESGA